MRNVKVVIFGTDAARLKCVCRNECGGADEVVEDVILLPTFFAVCLDRCC
jgi:hypothetical protein